MKRTANVDKLKLPTVAVHYDASEGIYEARFKDKGDVPFLGKMIEDCMTVGDSPDEALKLFRKEYKLDAVIAVNAKGDKLDPTNLNKAMTNVSDLVDVENLTADQVQAYIDDLELEDLRDKVLEVFTNRAEDDSYVSRLSDDVWATAEDAYTGLLEELQVAKEVASDAEANEVLNAQSKAETKPTKSKGKTSTIKPKADKTDKPPKVSTDGMITVADFAARYHTQGTKIRRILRPFYQANEELADKHEHQARWVWHPEKDKAELDMVYAELDRSFNVKS